MSGKISNHSVRKTCIKTLLDSGVSYNTVAQLSGHKNVKSLDSYAVVSHAQQRELSKILSGAAVNTTKSPKSSGADAPSTNEMQTRALFSGAQIGVINIQNLVLPGTSAPSESKDDSNGKKRRVIIWYHWVLGRRWGLTFNKLVLFDDTFCEKLIVCSLSFIHNWVVSLTAFTQ